MNKEKLIDLGFKEDINGQLFLEIGNPPFQVKIIFFSSNFFIEIGNECRKIKITNSDNLETFINYFK